MDGRTDLSLMQLPSGEKQKNLFDKEMPYFVRNKSQKPDLESRIMPEPSTIVDSLSTIQNVYRDAAPYTPSDHIRREMSIQMEGTSLCMLSRKTMYTIHKTGDPRIEAEILNGIGESNKLRFGRDPKAQWDQIIRNSDMIKKADRVLEFIEEKII